MKRIALLMVTGVLFLFLTGSTFEILGRGDTVTVRDLTGMVKSHTLIYMEGKIMFDELIKLAKAIQWERRTISGVICNGPGILFHFSLVSDQVGVVDGILYDGNSTAGQIMFDMAAVDDGSDRINLWPGRYFKKGLYFVATANVESVTFGFLPIKE